MTVSVFQEKWCHLVAEGITTIEVFDHVTLMTLDSLLKCAFSYNSNCQQWVHTLQHLLQLVNVWSLNRICVQVHQRVRDRHHGAE